MSEFVSAAIPFVSAQLIATNKAAERRVVQTSWSP